MDHEAAKGAVQIQEPGRDAPHCVRDGGVQEQSQAEPEGEGSSSRTLVDSAGVEGFMPRCTSGEEASQRDNDVPKSLQVSDNTSTSIVLSLRPNSQSKVLDPQKSDSLGRRKHAVIARLRELKTLVATAELDAMRDRQRIAQLKKMLDR